MWPSRSQLTYQGTITSGTQSVEGVIVLSQVKAKNFSNVARAMDGTDEILTFQMEMQTRVPYIRIDTEEERDMALEEQPGQLRIRVHNRLNNPAGRFSLTVEAFSYTLQGRMESGGMSDFIHVRNTTATGPMDGLKSPPCRIAVG